MEPGQQFEQLPMFMTAREVREGYAPVDREYGVYEPTDDSTHRIHPGVSVDRAT